MSTKSVVSAKHRYTAPAERVFDAWLTPGQAARFLFATRTGNIMRCEIDPFVGGSFVVTDRRPQADGDESVMDTDHRGEYVAIERPHLLSFDFSVPPGITPITRVTVEFTALSPNSCELVLTHDLGDIELGPAEHEQTRQGWDRMLTRLEQELFPRRIGVQL